VFGIKADSIAEANDKLYKEIGKGAYCWRYEVKKIPAGFKNPKNKLYK
jgi:hypothetical protein